MTKQRSSSDRRSHWLCIAYAFPPINRSGTHRTLGFVRHLDELGWNATVVTVDPGDEPIDESLLKRIPASTNVIRTSWTDPIEWVRGLYHVRPNDASSRRSCSAARRGKRIAVTNAFASPSDHGLREFVSRLLITPDSRVGWIRQGVRAGMRAVRRHRPDVVYSTSPYMSAHLIALTVSIRVGLPWVADFRDPWRDNPFRKLGFSVLDRWDAWLERIVLSRAAHVVCNTPTFKQRLCSRLPRVTGKCSTIMNGFDRELLDGVKPIRTGPPDSFILTHAGQFYGPRSPTVWFDALRHALEHRSELARKLRFALIGPSQYKGRDLGELAVMAGVGAQVDVFGPKNHAETLAHLAGSDALMLAGSAGPDNELQVPNKLFEYLAIRKPILACLPPTSPAVDVLCDANAEATICDPADSTSLAEAMTRLARDRYVNVPGAWNGVETFDRAHRAAELAEVFKRVSAGHTLQRTSDATLPHRRSDAPLQSTVQPGRQWRVGFG
ncbi:MAG: glycosyltransferase [Phycisphaerales bacterium]|nr:MAG: glycosyltransferase [Phycisphaerales bacterium]